VLESTQHQLQASYWFFIRWTYFSSHAIECSTNATANWTRIFSPLNARWFLALMAIKLQTPGIGVCKGLQPIRMWSKPHQTRNVTTVDRRDTLLLRAPIHVHAPLWHRHLIRHHHRTAMETLAQFNLDITMLKEESINWLSKKLRMPQWMVHSLSTRIPF
jgi:hypothetical protein